MGIIIVHLLSLIMLIKTKSIMLLLDQKTLEAGVSDALWEANIKVVGPKKELAKIETSKAFTRNLQVDYGIPEDQNFNLLQH